MRGRERERVSERERERSLSVIFAEQSEATTLLNFKDPKPSHCTDSSLPIPKHAQVCYS